MADLRNLSVLVTLMASLYSSVANELCYTLYGDGN